MLEPFALAIAFGAFIAIGTWPARDALVADGGCGQGASMVLLVVLILAVAVPATLIVPTLATRWWRWCRSRAMRLIDSPQRRPPG